MGQIKRIDSVVRLKSGLVHGESLQDSARREWRLFIDVCASMERLGLVFGHGQGMNPTHSEAVFLDTEDAGRSSTTITPEKTWQMASRVVLCLDVGHGRSALVDLGCAAF